MAKLKSDATTCEKGSKLENYFLGKMQKVDKRARRTKGSGNTGQAGDVENQICVVECKWRDTKDITIKEDVFKKLLSEVRVGVHKFPVYVLENTNGKRFAVMDLDDWFENFIYEQYEKVD
jgi:hypothetical protein